MSASRPGPAFGATFDDAALAEDLEHASAPGRAVALDARRQFGAYGVGVALLRPCLDEGRDGTRLPRCVKTYLPAPAGDWGMVFEVRLSEHGKPVLHCLAFGRRHPLRAAQPSVYELADGPNSHSQRGEPSSRTCSGRFRRGSLELPSRTAEG